MFEYRTRPSFKDLKSSLKQKQIVMAKDVRLI